MRTEPILFEEKRKQQQQAVSRHPHLFQDFFYMRTYESYVVAHFSTFTENQTLHLWRNLEKEILTIYV